MVRASPHSGRCPTGKPSSGPHRLRSASEENRCKCVWLAQLKLNLELQPIVRIMKVGPVRRADIRKIDRPAGKDAEHLEQ